MAEEGAQHQDPTPTASGAASSFIPLHLFQGIGKLATLLTEPVSQKSPAAPHTRSCPPRRDLLLAVPPIRDQVRQARDAHELSCGVFPSYFPTRRPMHLLQEAKETGAREGKGWRGVLFRETLTVCRFPIGGYQSFQTNARRQVPTSLPYNHPNIRAGPAAAHRINISDR